MGANGIVLQRERSNGDQNKITGFDYLRVLFMISVVTGHANLMVAWAAALEKLLGPGPNICDFIYFYLQSIAVPTFALISTILFCLKPITWEYTAVRIKKLSILYVFWVGVWVYCTRPSVEMTFLGVTEFLLRGGGWQFYFIVILMFMTVQAALITRLPRYGRTAFFALCVLLLIAMEAYVTIDYRWTKYSYYWVPLCFVLLPSFAVWIKERLPELRANAKSRWMWIGVMVVLGIFFSVIEWHFSAPRELLDEQRRWIPKHARFSIHLVALAVVIMALGIRREPGAIIRFLAKNSLGIYCLHGFVLGGFLKASQFLIGERFPLLVAPLACVTAITACAVVAEFLRRAFRERLV